MIESSQFSSVRFLTTAYAARALLIASLGLFHCLAHGATEAQATSYVGDINGDGLEDIIVRVHREDFIPMPGDLARLLPFEAISQNILLKQRADGGFDLVSPFSANDVAHIQAWHRADLDVRVDDYNADGVADVLLNDLGAHVSGARDQIVFNGVGAAGSLIREFDPKFVSFNEDFIGVLIKGSGYVLDNLEKVGEVCTGGSYIPIRVPVFDYLFEDTFDIVTVGHTFRCTSTMAVSDVRDFNMDALNAWIFIRRALEGEASLADVLAIFESVYGVPIGSSGDGCPDQEPNYVLNEADCTDGLRINKVVAAYLRGVQAAPAGVPSISVSLRATPAAGFFGFKHLSVANSRAYEWFRAGPSNPALALVGPDASLEKAKNFESRAASDELSLSVPVAYAFVPGQSTDTTWAAITRSYDAFPRPSQVSYCAFPEAGIAPDGTVCHGHNSNSFAKGLLDVVPGLILQEVSYIYRGKRRLELFPLNRQIYPGFEKPVDFYLYSTP